jgi:VIT1/CCC1 family predicted Fe2+/Mn2+ transporter
MDLQREKKFTLLSFLACTFVEGFGDFLVGEGSDAHKVYSLLCIIINVVLMMRWVVLDAEEHEFKMTRTLFAVFVAAAFIAAPYYFVKTRGTRGILALVLALLFVFPLGISFALGQWVAELSHLKPFLH